MTLVPAQAVRDALGRSEAVLRRLHAQHITMLTQLDRSDSLLRESKSVLNTPRAADIRFAARRDAERWSPFAPPRFRCCE
jgi:hypothetical protein